MSYPGQGYNGSKHHGGGGRPYEGYQQPYQQGYQQGYQQPYQQGYAQPPPGPPPPSGGGYSPGPGYGGGSGGYNNYRPPSGPPPPQYSSHGGYDNYGRPPPSQYNNNSGYRRQGGVPHGVPPPSTPQKFGHGAPDGYMFQYSKCTGKRKALLIGINYFGQKGELKGCINDVQNLSRFLIERYNYKREDMVILTDDQRNPVAQPTKANIVRAMQWLINDATSDDSLFLHYSGHGGQTEDLDGDEEDGYDEVIYPVDYQTQGHLVDDDLHRLVVRPLGPGVRLTAIFDSCHSASVLDLPYIYSTKGVLKEPNLAKEAGQGLLGAVSAYASGDIGGVAKSVFSFAKSAYRGDAAFERTKDTRTSPADVIMWSGSKDDQTSADATINAKATGAMSYAFIRALTQDPEQSYVELLNSIRDILEGKYNQKPQLSSSHPMDTDLRFVM